MRNKLLIAAYSATLLLAGSVFTLYLLRPEKSIKITWQDIFRRSSVETSLGDSTKINRLNKSAFDLRLENPMKTILLADSSLKLALKANYISGIGEAYRVKGIGHSNLNNNDQAVKNYFQAIKYFKINKDLGKEARVFNNIGLLYKEIDYQKALLYYNKALIISKKLKNNELTAGLNFNISNTLIDKGDFNNARSYLDASNQIFTSLRDTTHMIMYHQNLAVINLNLNYLEQAKESLFQAKSMAKKRNLFKILVGSNLSLTTIYLKEKNFPAAKKTIDEGIYYSNILKDSASKYYYIHHLYELEKAQNNPTKALQYLIQVHKHDSLLLSRNQTDNIDKSSNFYLQQQQIQENELIIAQQKYRETLYWLSLTIIFSLIILTALTGISTYALIKKKRQRKDIEIETRIILLEQKTLQAMVNPHFIFNVLNTIQYFVNKEDTQEANKIITVFSRLMRKHLEICLKSSITLKEEIEYLSLYLSLENIRFSDKMSYKITMEDNIDDEEIILPPMLIQPFIENAIWHGIMPKETGGSVDINIACKNDILQIKITDNGIGISNSIKNKSSGHISRGLELIEERVSLLNKLNTRKISINKIQTGESGTEVLIQIPV